MTNTLKYALFFIGGLALGGSAGYVSAKMVLEKHYNKKFEDAISDMEEYFQAKDEYVRTSDVIVDDEAEVNPASDNYDRSQGVLSEDARAEIKEKLMKNYETTSERASVYANAYKEAHPESLEGGDNLSGELTRDGAEIDEEIDPALQATLDHQAHKNDPPRIITSDEFDALPPHIDTQTLYFYHDDETVVDDDDDVIEDPALLVGNTLGDFIDDINNPIMFVYNPALDTAYEIQRVEGAYYDG